MTSIWYYQTKIGIIGIEEQNKKLIGIHFKQIKDPTEETEFIKEVHKQIVEYLDGKRKTFTLSLELKGTIFQKKVWEALQKIPYGQTKSYQEIAVEINNSKSSRAVGAANHNNPIPLIIPCHRVIGKSGKLIGYAGGIPLKTQLLNIEKDNK